MKRAIVIGGSLGGLLAGNLLHRAGWRVDIYERVGDALAERGAGVVTHAELEAVFIRLGISIEESLGVPVAERVTLDRSGHVIGRRTHPQVLTAWGRLYTLLKQAFPEQHYHAGKQFDSLAQRDGKVTVTFADGSSEECDLLVGADGIRSTIRSHLLPNAIPQYAGYVAWRGLVEESELPEDVHQMLFGRFGFCLPPCEQMLGYPVAGARNALEPGKRRYNFVWYRPADGAELQRLSTDESGKVHENGIPPPLIRATVRTEMRQFASANLAPQFAEIVARTAMPFFQPIYDLESSALVFGRVALLGDAGFVARPHCGMGVTKAAGDAVTLVDSMERLGIDAGLAHYNHQRVRFGQEIVEHARRLGAYMQAQLKTPYEREMAERYRTPAAVMRETAAAPAAPSATPL